LAADAVAGFRAGGGSGVFHAHQIGGQPNDTQRPFQVVNHRAGKPAHHGAPFGLQGFRKVLSVEFAQALADLAQERQRQGGRLPDAFLHRGARQKQDRGLRQRPRAG
jgi:hypothetical protein